MKGNPTALKELKSKVIQNWWIYYKGKSMLKPFSFYEPSSGP